MVWADLRAQGVDLRGVLEGHPDQPTMAQAWWIVKALPQDTRTAGLLAGLDGGRTTDLLELIAATHDRLVDLYDLTGLANAGDQQHRDRWRGAFKAEEFYARTELRRAAQEQERERRAAAAQSNEGVAQMFQ